MKMSKSPEEIKKLKKNISQILEGENIMSRFSVIDILHKLSPLVRLVMCVMYFQKEVKGISKLNNEFFRVQYGHFYNQVKLCESLNILTVKKKGRDNFVMITENGKKLVERLFLRTI